MIECPSWPQANTRVGTPANAISTSAVTVLMHYPLSSLCVLAELFDDGIRGTQRQRPDRQRRISDCACDKDTAANNVEVGMVHRATVRIDHTRLALLAHAGGPHDVAGAEEGRVVQN